jgi:hypothetical protein
MFVQSAHNVGMSNWTSAKLAVLEKSKPKKDTCPGKDCWVVENKTIDTSQKTKETNKS